MTDVIGELIPLPEEAPAVRGGQTSAGLRYPSPQDPMCHTDQYIHDLADDITYRLTNRSMQVSNPVLTTDANANLTLTFPRFSTLQGLVVQPYAAGGGSGGVIWTLYPFLSQISGNSAIVHVWYAQNNLEGYAVNNFANAQYQYMVFGWGVPV
jgi:hypothetical protein